MTLAHLRADELDAHLYMDLVRAYVRGRLGARADGDDAADAHAAVARGEAAGLSLHRFKRTQDLPRVRRVLGILRALAPASLLDVGSGRGTFLWPLLDALPDVAVTAIDRDPHRVAELAYVRDGGVARLDPRVMDATALALPDASVDVVTALEVLEHLPDPRAAAAEALRVTRSVVVVSVPAKPDDNPEHIHFFEARALSELLVAAGAASVQLEHVLNHRVAIARRPA